MTRFWMANAVSLFALALGAGATVELRDPDEELG